MPAATMPLSGWFDYEVTGDSMESNNGKDLLLHREWVKSLGAMFLGEKGNPRDPYVSPLYADQVRKNVAISSIRRRIYTSVVRIIAFKFVLSIKT